VSTGIFTYDLGNQHSWSHIFREAPEHFKHPPGSGICDKDLMGHWCLPAPLSRRGSKFLTQLSLPERFWCRITVTQP